MRGAILGGRATMRYSASTSNIVCDGNSLVYGYGSSGLAGTFESQLALLAPLNGTVAIANSGVSGDTFAKMRARRATSVDAKYVAGKNNFLAPWEGTNTICNASMTGAAAFDDLQSYNSEALAVHPDWWIILITTLPRYDVSAGSWTVAQANAELIAYNNLILANWRTMPGVKGVVDVRASGLWAYTTDTRPASQAPYMYDQIHCNDAGYALIAGCIAAVLKRLPAR